jgi:hypothetical protein
MTTGTFYRLARTWRNLIVHRKVDPERVRLLDQSKVAIVTEGIVKGGSVTVDDALADAATLGWRDLRDKYAKVESTEADTAKSGSVSSAGDAGEDDPATSVEGAEPPAPASDNGTPRVAAPTGNGAGPQAPGDEPTLSVDAVREALKHLDAGLAQGAQYPGMPRDSFQVCADVLDDWLAAQANG